MNAKMHARMENGAHLIDFLWMDDWLTGNTAKQQRLQSTICKWEKDTLSFEIAARTAYKGELMREWVPARQSNPNPDLWCAVYSFAPNEVWSLEETRTTWTAMIWLLFQSVRQRRLRNAAQREKKTMHRLNEWMTWRCFRYRLRE